MHRYKDKKVLVTGGTAGIGREIARAFAREGAHVCIWGTNTERAQEVVQMLQKEAPIPEQNFSYHIVDVASKAGVEEKMALCLSAWGTIDVVVNNAGITRDALLMKMTEEQWDLVLDTNLKSVYNLCGLLIRPMMKARSGAIINISSVVGLMGNAGQTNYAASKAGMIGFSKALAREVASRGITVNCIAPGFIQTNMTEVLSVEQKQALLAGIPLARLGTCEEIAEAVLFLAGARYITGQVLSVDGGMVM